jgi:23S rRNA pseudouridine1911/1915/1917 synthase
MVDGEGAREAITYITVLRRQNGASLLDVKLGSGRTHQIRVHLSHIGYPIVGDDLYGGAAKRLIERLRPDQGPLKSALRRLNRPFLHAWQIQFGHPSRGGYAVFHAPPAEELRHILRLAFGTDDLEALGFSGEVEPAG